MQSRVKCYTVHRCWLHMMTSSNGNIFRVTGHLCLCAGNSPVPGEFPAQRPVTRSFDVFFDLHPINGWINNDEAGDLKRHRAHYDVTVMRGVNVVWYIRVNHKCNTFRVFCMLMYELRNNSQFKSLLSNWYLTCLSVVSSSNRRKPNRGNIRKWQLLNRDVYSWYCYWRQYIMTASWHVTLFALQAICMGNPSVTNNFPSQRASQSNT